MAHILFVVDIPSVEEGVVSSVHMNTSSKWMRFEGDSKSTTLPSSSSKQLCRNVWLLDAKNGLPPLLELSGLADTCGLSYSAHLLEGEVTTLTKQLPGWTF